MPTRTFPLPLPVDLGPTLSELRVGPSDPTIRVLPDQVLRAAWTPTGPATLHVRVWSGEATAEAWGPGADWALTHAPSFVGAADCLDGFDPTPHPAVERFHARLPAVRIGRSGQVYDVLVPTILAQKVTGLEAKTAWYRMIRWWGRPAPGPGGLRLPPPPDVLAGQPYWALHRAGVERTRAVTVIEACRRIDRLEEAATMRPVDAHARLTAVRGIGDWTAGIIRRVALGDPDAVETGDYHLPNLVAWNLAGESRADDARMLALLAPFVGHRGRALRLIELGGRAAPRYGARMAPGPIHSL